MTIRANKNMPSIDPVCGLEIIPKKKYLFETIKGHTYYFCTEKCCATFNNEPSKYIHISYFTKLDKDWLHNFLHVA